MIKFGEAKAVIGDERDDARFEHFCNEVVSLMTGRPVLGTAAGGDLGVDGRSAIQLDALAGDVLVASSVRKDARQKMEEDAERIRATHKAGEVYFCTSRPLNEVKKAEARRSVQRILGASFTTHVLTQEELGDLALRYEGPLKKAYGQDIQRLRQNVAEMLAERGGTAQLQVAHALTSDEGLTNRDRIAELLVSEVLAVTPATANEVAVRLQAVLRIPTAFPRYVVDAAIARLVQNNGVHPLSEERFELTDSGRAARKVRLDQTANEEERRKKRLAQEFTTRLGFQLDPKQQDALWANLMHQMSGLLASAGARFIGLIEAARANRDLSEVRTMTAESVRTACKAAVQTIPNAKVRAEAEDALYHALLDDASVALEWLEEVLAAWLAACQLGLVPEVSQQLKPALTRLVLALDTDIVLSLLCEAEPDHSSLVELLSQWSGIGGRTYIAPEVLTEVAHHAWIAKVEFAEVASIIQKHRYTPGLSRQVARNAFVRAYWASGRRGPASDFDRYIRSYAGDREDDTRSVEYTLSRSSIGESITQPTAAARAPFQQVEARVRGVLARLARWVPNDASGNAIEQDKLERDAAAVVKYAAVAHSSSSVESLLLLSSSKKLSVGVRQGAAGARIVVAPASTLGLLLAAATAHQLRPQSIAQLMLAEGAREQVGYLRSELVRMLARSDLLGALPPARIVSLEREVDFAIVDYAKKSSRTRQQVRRDVLTAANRETALEVFGEALRRSALGSEVDRLVRTQAEEIARLRESKTADGGESSG